MAPSDKEIREAVLQGTYEVYENDPSDTSVNKVRKYVEEKLSLDDGFFSSGEWKTKSKELIKQRVGELLDGWVPEPKDEGKSDMGVKRRSTSTESPDHKRQKRGPKTKKLTKKSESSIEELSEEEKPKPVKRKAGRPKTKAKVVESEDESSLSDLEMEEEEEEEEEEEKPKPKRKAAGRPKTKAKVVESDDESSLSDLEIEEEEDYEEEEEEKPKPKRKAPSRPTTKAKVTEPEDESSLSELGMEDESMKSEKETAPDDDAVMDLENGDEASEKNAEKEDEKKDEATAPAPIDEEEEYSDVIDEPVKPKRKKGAPKEKKTATAKAPKASKPARKSSLTSDDPNEAEIKRLQSNLIKCGIRKLWHNELKKYGDDSRAKIKHLKQMLADAGMDGRFSEAKAREIKERRELLAELEATQEMNELWGIDSKGRASRSKSKNVKEESTGEGEGGEDDEEEEEEEEQQAFAARRRRAQADLAFLGDDSDSD